MQAILRRVRGALAAAGVARRTRPLSEHSGFDRGTPVDRLYIEQFLAAHAADVRGRVLEIKDDAYTRRFGRAVTSSDVLDIDPANRDASIHADLAAMDGVPAERFDCVVLTQTLQYVYDLRAAIGEIHRVVAPGGVVLATVPSVSGVGRPEDGASDFWRFTVDGCRRLFHEHFSDVTVEPRGNVMAAAALLSGLAVEELPRRRLVDHDARTPVIVTVRAVRRRVSSST